MATKNQREVALAREQARVSTLLHELAIATADLERLQRELSKSVRRLRRIDNLPPTLDDLDALAAGRIADKQQTLDEALLDIGSYVHGRL